MPTQSDPGADDGPFHAGERRVQEAAGALVRIAQIGRVAIRDHMPEQHREFFTLLPFILIGSIDAHTQPCASILTGPPGFVHSPEEHLLRIDALPTPDDPLAANLRIGASIGLLGIAPHSARRNRVNGRVVAIDTHGFALAVRQSFGNCPKYIVRREPRLIVRRPGPVLRGDALETRTQALIRGADTFYIASAHPLAAQSGLAAHGVDISHRAGPAGFVRLDAGNRLFVPDYAGNRYFNTLGNLVLNPRTALAFIDYDTGDLLQARGTASLLHEAPGEDGGAHTGRVLSIELQAWSLRQAALPLAWRAGPTSAG